MKSVRFLILFVALSFGMVIKAISQSTPARAMKHVILHTANGNIIRNGTIVWRNGIIKAAGRNVSIPFDAYTIDGGDSLHVYPGFLDGLALWGSPDLPEKYKEPDRPGAPGYARAGIQTFREPHTLLKAKDGQFPDAQKQGFVTAALGLKGHMLPGQVDLFFINGNETGDYLLASHHALLASFEPAAGHFGNGAYPATLMGVMARYRQLWYDAAALKDQEKYYASTSSDYPAPDKDQVLEALFPVIDKEQPVYFIVDSGENIERLFWLKDELDFHVVVLSGKEAYKKAGELKRRKIPVLASIELPEEPAWSKKEESEAPKKEITEAEMNFRRRQMEAYQARVDNIRKLRDAGVKVGYASNGLKPDEFRKHLKKLKEKGGLDENDILEILTQNTADILGVGNRLGDLKKGRIASFTVFSKPFLDDKAKAIYSVSDGHFTKFQSEESK